MIHLTEPLVFVTGNLDKVKSTQRYVHIPLLHKKVNITEIQSLDTHEVIEHKVKEAYKILGKPILVEDTALVFHALGKLPGTFIKWFLEEIGEEGLCRIVDNKDRSATATVTFAVYDGTSLHICEAPVKGTIADHPRGTSGFGWDTIFIPKGETKTHAEMTQKELDKINVRRFALEKLKKVIKV